MSLSVWLAAHGLGGVAAALTGVETAVVRAVQSSPQVEALETQTVDELGSAAQQTVVGAITKANPQAGQIAGEVSSAFLPALEAFTLHFFQNATVTAETKPPAA